MDWSKAKNVLIIAFIITNIYLIYYIEKDMFDEDALSARSEQKIKEVVQILEDKNIGVEAEVPMEVLELPVLDVEYITYDKNTIKQLFTKDRQDGDEGWELSLQLNNKVLQYKKKNIYSNGTALTEKKARYEAEKFLKNYGLMSSDVMYWNQKTLDNRYQVLFKQRYKGRILEYSYMLCTVTESGVVAFERMWMKPLKFGVNKKEIIPAPKALLKFLDEHVGSEDMVITDISLVYWLDLSHDGFSNWENIESGTAIPAWRIELNDGEASFIPAFENY